MLASTLSGKQVMSTDGQQVGRLHNITIDPATGSLESVIVETERTEIFGTEQDSEGHIELPATVLEAVRDHVIITPPPTAQPE
ncbi:PRC-barrel domain-containing protein [Haloarcula halophila]|uniref:PRC-barrel domain-containing protein n=1 Tax=Haloarcula TaxID=2237 RepID=UPI0023E367E0|nr:PRC-barrel domain-containing protein [Halomicroarcula sp. DFY41]